MTKATKKAPSRLTKALLEIAGDMHKGGMFNGAEHEKITMRLIGSKEPAPTATPISGEDIRAIRERARMSQAVFAHYLNVTVGYISQLERGAKRPTGAALALLNVIRRKGIEAIL
jgi:putative transcriptional regulator